MKKPQEQLRTLVAAKLEQGDALDTAAAFGEESEAPDTTEVVDLVEALRRSVEADREKRARGGTSGPTGDTKAASEEAPAKKKSTAEKAAAKKAPTKKSVKKSA